MPHGAAVAPALTANGLRTSKGQSLTPAAVALNGGTYVGDGAAAKLLPLLHEAAGGV